MKDYEISDLEQLLDIDHPAEHYTFRKDSKTLEDGFVVLHTSGSTGLPKVCNLLWKYHPQSKESKTSNNTRRQ